MNLKPSEEIQVSALSAAVVYGIFQLNTPNLADVRNAPAGNRNVHGSVKTAAWTSAVVISGLALLAKSPTIFIVGSVMIVGETWKFFHANATSPETGQVDMQAMQGMSGSQG
jgi:hypothetical protein